MLSSETETRLARLLITQAKHEQRIETHRQILAKFDLFNPFSAFLRIDKLKKGYITEKDILNFLEQIQGKSTKLSLYLKYVCKFWDSDKDGKLSYTDFLNFILPSCNAKLRVEVCLRDIYPLSPNQRLSAEIEITMSTIFEKEIEMIKEIERLKIDLISRNDFKFNLLFKSIDKTGLGYLTYGNISYFFKRKFIKFNRNDIDALLIRFDKDKDTKMSEFEFCQILTPFNQEKISARISTIKFNKSQYNYNYTKTKQPMSDMKYTGYSSLNRSIAEINSEEKERYKTLSPSKFRTLK